MKAIHMVCKHSKGIKCSVLLDSTNYGNTSLNNMYRADSLIVLFEQRKCVSATSGKILVNHELNLKRNKI